MTTCNGQTLSYDADGNLIGDGANTYAWDARNHLTTISGGVSARFLYDPFGRRTEKMIGGTTTQFLYDGLNPVQELDGANPPNATAEMLTGVGIDEYFQRTDSSGAMAFLTDALGSTIGLTNSAGSLATNYTYDPFGATTMGGTSNANSYQFTGRENDGTGLYYYRARYYQPTFQRFVAQDPIGFAGGDPNLYGYAFESPTYWIDLLGLDVTVIEYSGAGVNGFGHLAVGVNDHTPVGLEGANAFYDALALFGATVPGLLTRSSDTPYGSISVDRVPGAA